jgi:hypothetical protein
MGKIRRPRGLEMVRGDLLAIQGSLVLLSLPLAFPGTPGTASKYLKMSSV